LEIGTCQGPCAAGCTHSDYLERVQAARDFLEGLDLSLIAQATRDMETASARLNFEKAAALRDQLEILHWLHQHLERLRQARQQHSFIYPVRGYGGEVTWYLIHQGQVKTALSAPRSAPAWAAAAEAIGKCFRDGQSAPASLSPQEVDEVLLVAAWFRKHPEERARVKNPGKALEGARINA
jgi:excinuclease ABC subunit C